MDVIYTYLQAYFRLTNINFKLNKLIDSKFGAETAQWLERWTRDRKVSGSSLGRSSGTKFFLQGQLWVLTLISVSVPIVRKRSRSFCQKCRSQVSAKHACTLSTWLCVKWRDMVHGCMVYTKSAPRRQQFHVALPRNNQTALQVHHFGRSSKRAIKSWESHDSHESLRITCDKRAVSPGDWERRIALYKSDQQQLLWNSNYHTFVYIN